MKAVVIKEPYKVAVEERPIPKCKNPTDAVVKISASGEMPSIPWSSLSLDLTFYLSPSLPKASVEVISVSRQPAAKSQRLTHLQLRICRHLPRPVPHYDFILGSCI